jgi:broad specificity phosphatase PhoE
MQSRAVDAVREVDAHVADEAGPDAVWVAVSHGDVIKAVLADALGLHLDQFQRIVVAPASVSVIRYTPLRPFVMHLNDHGSDLAALRPPKRRRRKASSDAVVGGGPGAAPRPGPHSA